MEVSLRTKLISITTLIASIAVLFTPYMNTQAKTTQQKEISLNGLGTENLSKIFSGYDAAFVLFDTKSKQYFRYNPSLCKERLSPCSTFKIFNSLVGLETEIVKNENHTIKWNGTKYSIESWNHDQTLQSAFSNSAVWYYQQIASAIGSNQMAEFIHKVHYGNEDISGGITKFWLGSTLKISANEQVDFLNKLINDDLPFSKRSMAIVRGLMKLDTNSSSALYGKTGSDMKNDKQVLGWFVGYLVQPDQIYIFATNIQTSDNASGQKAKELTKMIFAHINHEK